MKIFALFLMSQFLFSCAFKNTQVGINEVKTERTIKTLKMQREENIVMQKYDFSCGIASLMTLFQYHFGGDVLDERKVLAGFLVGLSEERRKDVVENGLSVLDLKSLSVGLGYKVFAVTLKKESLLNLDRPILVYLENPDYKHFSVLRGVKNATVFLSDSSTGNTRMSVPVFLKMWKGRVAIFLDAPQRGVSKLEIRPEELQKPEMRLLQGVL